MNLLVSGMGGDVARGLLKHLSESHKQFVLHGLGLELDGLFDVKQMVEVFVPSPPVSSEGYVEFVRRVIIKYGIDLFIPTIDSEILLIAKERSRLEFRTGCRVFVRDLKSTLICDDKYLTYQFLVSNRLPAPDSHLYRDFDLDDTSVVFPLIVKARQGRGSADVKVVESREKLVSLSLDNSWLIQEHLGEGDEYTSSAFLSSCSKYFFEVTFRRTLRGGRTVFAERVIDDKVTDGLKNIVAKLGPGFVNIQWKFKGDEVVPFEFNPRLSGTIYAVSRIMCPLKLWQCDNLPDHLFQDMKLSERIIRFHRQSNGSISAVEV